MCVNLKIVLLLVWELKEGMKKTQSSSDENEDSGLSTESQLGCTIKMLLGLLCVNV